MNMYMYTYVVLVPLRLLCWFTFKQNGQHSQRYVDNATLIPSSSVTVSCYDQTRDYQAYSWHSKVLRNYYQNTPTKLTVSILLLAAEMLYRNVAIMKTGINYGK